MFKNIIEFFTKTQEIKNKRFKDFEELYIKCVKEFPNELKIQLRKCSICPISYDAKLEQVTGHDHHKWLLGFTYKDILWWREEYKNDNFTMLPVETIEKKIKQCCLEFLDSCPLGDTDEDLKNIHNSIIEEYMQENEGNK